MPASLTYTLEIDGKQFTFNDDKDITLANLRQIKAWFPDLGSYGAFRVAYLQGDPDALACIRWVVRGRNKITPNPEPLNPDDFALGDFMNSFVFSINTPCEACGGSIKDRRAGRGWNPSPQAEEAVDPTDQAPAGSPENGSGESTTETPNPFVRSISGSSDKSAI